MLLLVRTDVPMSRPELAAQAARTVLGQFKKQYKRRDQHLRAWEEAGHTIQVCGWGCGWACAWRGGIWPCTNRGAYLPACHVHSLAQLPPFAPPLSSSLPLNLPQVLGCPSQHDMLVQQAAARGAALPTHTFAAMTKEGRGQRSVMAIGPAPAEQLEQVCWLEGVCWQWEE